MVQLVLVRHGETDANKTHTIQGHLDTSLSELGEKQAVKVGELLAKENFHLAITSDLKRAKSTGQAICDRNSSFESLKAGKSTTYEEIIVKFVYQCQSKRSNNNLITCLQGEDKYICRGIYFGFRSAEINFSPCAAFEVAAGGTRF